MPVNFQIRFNLGSLLFKNGLVKREVLIQLSEKCYYKKENNSRNITQLLAMLGHRLSSIIA